MLTDKFFLAETWQMLICRHAGADRVVVRGDVLEALIAHAARNQCFGALDRLYQLTGRETKLLGAEPRRGLRLGRCHGWYEEDGNDARVDPLLHRDILSTVIREITRCQ